MQTSKGCWKVFEHVCKASNVPKAKIYPKQGVVDIGNIENDMNK